MDVKPLRPFQVNVGWMKIFALVSWGKGILNLCCFFHGKISQGVDDGWGICFFVMFQWAVCG